MREDWIEVEFNDVLEIVSGKNQKQVLSEEGQYPIYGSGGIIGRAKNYLCEEGTTIIGRKGTINSPIYVNKQFWNVDTAFGLSPFPFLEKRLLFFFSIYFNFKKLDKSTTIPSLAKRDLLKIKFPLSPLPEQRAIVAKIEELFSDLDKGIDDLKKAQDQLVIFRQAVLKKAFEGELTKEWRAQQTDLPTADELLEQIKEERQKHYQQLLENWKEALKSWVENGKDEKKPSTPSKYKLFNSPVRPLNLSLPQNWFFDCVGNTCSKTEYGSSSKSSTSGDIPVLRMGNMQDGKIDWGDLKYSSDAEEIKQYFLNEGDVLFNRTNSPELVGKTVQYKGEQPAIFAGYLIRLNQIDNIISGAYLNHFLNSHSAKVYGSFVKTDGVNQSNINGDKLSNYPIPICALEEQHQIVQEIEFRLSVCDKVEQSITESLEKAKALRQSILKKAFEGTLLSEEEIKACKAASDYEPANVLLERIKEEKNFSTVNKLKKI